MGEPVEGDFSGAIRLGAAPRRCHLGRVRHFFTGQVIKTELLVEWLGKHEIAAVPQWVDPTLPDDGDLSREARVMVPEADYDRAYRLFYAEREDEI